MIRSIEPVVVTTVLLARCHQAQQSRAQHVDVLVQSVAGQLATGSADFDSGQWTTRSARVFRRIRQRLCRQ